MFNGALAFVQFVRDVRTWREDCWQHDADMGNPPRMFIDEEEWERLEKEADKLIHKLEASGVV